MEVLVDEVMSSGHSHVEGFGLNSQALDRLLRNDKVQECLHSPRELNTSYDVPYLGGYSKDGKVIYFDRHLPKTVLLKYDDKKLEIDPTTILQLHESFEKSLIDVLDMGYTQAHKAATAYERRGLLMRYGPNWWGPYCRSMEKYIKADEHEKLKRLPPDLDMLPYYTSPVDHRLVSHMEKVMGKKKK